MNSRRYRLNLPIPPTPRDNCFLKGQVDGRSGRRERRETRPGDDRYAQAHLPTLCQGLISLDELKITRRDIV